VSDARDILLIGGRADGRNVTVLHGDSVIMHGEDWREEYAIVRLAGSTKAFFVGVPRARALDGDWLIDKLLVAYDARNGR
jgi:hypothetical protein